MYVVYGLVIMVQVEAALHPEKMRALKAEILAKRYQMPLFDTKKYVADFEKALKKVCAVCFGTASLFDHISSLVYISFCSTILK